MFLNTTTKEARSTLFSVFEFTLVLEFPQTNKKKVLEDLKRHKSCNINSQLQKKFFFLVNNNIY